MASLSPGIVLALLSAALFSLNTPIASYGQSLGGDALVYAAFRGLTSTVIAGVAMKIGGVPFHVPKKHRFALLLVTLAIAFQGMTYLSAVGYIPVGLAALLFYMFPVLVAIFAAIVRQGPTPGPMQWLCFLGAFLGLALALGPDFAALDWRGVALAMASAVLVAIYFVAARSSLGQVSVLALCFYGNIGAAVIAFGATLLINQSIEPLLSTLPTGPAFALAVIFPLSFLLQLAALKRADAGTVALIFNIEPLLSIGIAAVFLNEMLAGIQLVGALVVVGALSIYTRLSRGKT